VVVAADSTIERVDRRDVSLRRLAWGEGERDTDIGSVEGMDIHHIVEQCQSFATRSGFDVTEINSTDNIIRLPEDIHDQISAYYSSRPSRLRHHRSEFHERTIIR
jgi:hypothetical protein